MGSGNRWLLPVSLVGMLCVGIGVGIGIGAGIWKENGNNINNDTNALTQTTVCADGSHADPLVTYVLSVDDASLKVASPELSLDGVAVDVTIPKASLPSVMPFLVNDVTNGTLYQNLLNTTGFLEDWAELSALDNVSTSEFVMPAAAAAKQCVDSYEMDVSTSVQNTPANAMVILHAQNGVHRMAQVYNVRDEGDQIVLKMELVTGENATTPLPEGRCHEYQDLSLPHFHHASTCTELDADWIVDVDSLGNTTGLTVFVKLIAFAG